MAVGTGVGELALVAVAFGGPAVGVLVDMVVGGGVTVEVAVGVFVTVGVIVGNLVGVLVGVLVAGAVGHTGPS